MKIGIVGLGLIGGSMAKAIKENTDHVLMGHDRDPAVTAKALAGNVIDELMDPLDMSTADLIFVCLHPKQTIDFIKDHLESFQRGSIVCDVCGVKRLPTKETEALLIKNDIAFIGTHPMAGREFSGYDYADAAIFRGASFIITPTDNSSEAAIETICELAAEMNFGSINITSPEQHDQIIAYTSQLAHIASNAYVKSPMLANQKGYSAGSFQDLTRVAKLNEDLWTSLFMMNKDYLLLELTNYMDHLEEYKEALETGDVEAMTRLLRDGRLLKEESLR